MKKSILIIVLSALLAIPGCGLGVGEVMVASSAVVAGAKVIGVVWKQIGGMRGCQEASAYYEYDAETIRRASLAALRELDVPVTMDVPNENEEGYYLETSEKTQFKIKIIPVQDNITELKVRVNRKSEKEAAELFYRLVMEHIGSVQYNNTTR